jgi:formylglycine-generating enzyme required for sulfatase activity
MRPYWRQELLIGSIGAYAAACIVIAAFAGAGAPGSALPDMIELPPASLSHRSSGEFTQNGRPATAPLATVTIPRPLAVMRHQVTDAEYRRCVEAGACPALDGDQPAGDFPVVKVSWRDAQAYAAWLSNETGERFRLPTDEEWAYAAASRFKDDAIQEADDPGRRALAIYARDRGPDTEWEPRPVGTFGANENGLVDIAGNVWEWTDTCFTRRALDAGDEAAAGTVHCGVRVVEGRHRGYVSDFVRDARSGGCSAGAPLNNLGFRLVRDDNSWRLLHRLIVMAQQLVGPGARREG